MWCDGNTNYRTAMKRSDRLYGLRSPWYYSMVNSM